MTRDELLAAGSALGGRWCDLNDIPLPVVSVSDEPTMFDTCAFYRDGVITIWPAACATPGMAHRFWSYPGYTVDRTPYGVVIHELGHHVDKAHGAAGGLFGRTFRAETREEPITSYCDNDNEWFAEMFRVFVCNPDLLSKLRPLTFGLMHKQWPKFAETRAWTEVLAEVPRQLSAARNKIEELERKQRRLARQGRMF